jgi:HEAT repeat protein
MNLMKNIPLMWLLALALASPTTNAQVDLPTAAGRDVRHHEDRSDRSDQPTDEEALAIAALRALMAAPPERALPLVERTLQGSQSERVKIRALFVLAQIDTAAARTLLLKYTQPQPTTSLKMRLEAIRMIGIGGDPSALQALKTSYDNGDFKTKEAVLRAWQIAEAKALLLAAARTESNPELVERAVMALAAMGARTELRQLGDAGVDPNRLVKAYGVSRDLDALKKLALESTNPAVQANAAQHIGIVGGKDALAALQSLYQETTSAEVRRGALEGMMIAGDAAGLMKLYRASNNAQEKRRLLEKLTIVGGDDALDAIDAALEGKAP